MEQDLKNVGLKVTVPRVKILEILASKDARHWSAEDVYKQLTQQGIDVALATVYRVLTQFEEAGLVVRHRFAEDHCVFELDNTEHHDHLICVTCGKVEEFVDSIIESRQKDIANQYDFEITDHTLLIFGFCPECKQS